MRALRGCSALAVAAALAMGAVPALAGCSGSSSGAVTPSAPNPTLGGVAADSSSGIRFSLPTGFHQVASQAEVDAIFAARAHPGQGVPRYTAGQVLAVRPDTLTVVQAGATPNGAGSDVRALQPKVTSALTSAGAKDLTTSVVKVGPDDALRNAYRTESAGTALQHVDVVFAHAGRYYALTFQGVQVDDGNVRTVLGSLSLPTPSPQTLGPQAPGPADPGSPDPGSSPSGLSPSPS